MRFNSILGMRCQHETKMGEKSMNTLIRKLNSFNKLNKMIGQRA
jgi:hypothetical protein